MIDARTFNQNVGNHEQEDVLMEDNDPGFQNDLEPGSYEQGFQDENSNINNFGGENETSQMNSQFSQFGGIDDGFSLMNQENDPNIHMVNT